MYEMDAAIRRRTAPLVDAAPARRRRRRLCIQRSRTSGSGSTCWRRWTSQTRREVMALLAYAEDDAGGLMNAQYARLRPDVSVDEAISYLRKPGARQARDRLLRLRATTPSEAGRRRVAARAVRGAQ
jgi:hypothetical protein